MRSIEINALRSDEARDATSEQGHPAELAARALRECLAGHDGVADLARFQARHLEIVTAVFGSPSATLWSYQLEERTVTLLYALEDGVVVPAARSRHPWAGKPYPQPRSDPGLHAMLRGESVFVPTRDYADPTHSRFNPAFAQLFEAQGIRAMLSVPLRVAGRTIGALVLRLPSDAPIAQERLQLAETLASQAALVLHVEQLSQAQRQLEIERERAEAADRRTAELVKANAALAQTTAALSVRRNVDAYLSAVLRVLLEQMGTDSGSLWTADEHDRYRLHSEIVDGAPRALDAADHPIAHRVFDEHLTAPPDGAGRFQRLRHQRLPSVIPDVEIEPDDDEAARRYMLSLGVRAQMLVPMFAGDVHLGAFSVRSKVPRTWTLEQLELAQALANQAAVAMEMHRLSQSEKEAAVAKERAAAEQHRAERLAAANLLLLKSAERIGTVDDIDDFLGQVLVSINDLLGGHSGTVWAYDASRSNHRLRCVIENGIAVRAEQSAHPDHPSRVGPGLRWKNPALTPSDETPVQVMVDAPASAFTTDERAYLQAMGVRALVAAPIALNGQFLGVFTIRLTDDRPLLQDDKEIVQALANQAAVALRLTQLADEARQAAVAREREEAAQARAAKLEQANSALRQTVEALRSTEDLETLLGRTLMAITQHLGAPSATVWLHEAPSAAYRLLYLFEEGTLTRAERSQHPNATVTSHAVRPYIEAIAGQVSGRAHPVVMHVSPTLGLTSEQLRYLESCGVKTLLAVPMLLGSEPVGVFVVRIAAHPPPLADDLAVVQALANQATLALHLSRLAKSARDAAILREREDAAYARVAELVHANATLRRGVDTLTEQPSLDAFLQDTLRVIGETLQAQTAAWWHVRQPQAELRYLYGREIGFVDFDAERPSAPRSVDYDVFAPARPARRAAEPYLADLTERAAFRTLDPAAGAHLNFARLRCVPIVLRGEIVGLITARHDSVGESPTAERIEIVKALANQVALAMQMEQLADVARSVAVAREREQIAVARAAELRDTNDALKRSLAVLVSERDIERFLGRLLDELRTRTGARLALLWSAEHDGTPIVRRFSAATPSAVPLDDVRLAALLTDFVGVNETTWRRDATASDPRYPLVPGSRADGNAPAVLHLPLNLSDERFSAIALLAPDDAALRTDQLEQLQAWAHHASLGVRLDALTLQARGAAVLQERARLAREVHDSIVQSFIAIGMQLHAASTHASSTALARAVATAEQGLADARRAIEALRPVHLNDRTFVEAVRALLVSAVGDDLRVRFVCSGAWGAVSADQEAELFRIVQEAVHNVLKHASATEIAIELSSVEGEVSILVSDNGQGFDIASNVESTGFGLFSMRQRAQLIGATLQIVSAAGRGTQLLVSLRSQRGDAPLHQDQGHP